MDRHSFLRTLVAMYGTVPSGGMFDLVVVAASQGGLAASRQVLGALPREFPAAVIVLQHRPPSAPDRLPELFARHVSLPVNTVESGQLPQPGTVYVAPADRQLVLDPAGRFAMAELEARLALADPLFASVATAAGPRAIAVVLTGRLQDGAAGVQAIKRAGGRVLVQDQATAECFGMPSAAIATGCVDFILPLGTMAPALITLAMAPGAAAWLQVPVPSWAPSLASPATRLVS
jgi:two-component system, chemotaxis family, protein-glutamate methylesterase/glutaminase